MAQGPAAISRSLGPLRRGAEGQGRAEGGQIAAGRRKADQARGLAAVPQGEYGVGRAEVDAKRRHLINLRGPHGHVETAGLGVAHRHVAAEPAQQPPGGRDPQAEARCVAAARVQAEERLIDPLQVFRRHARPLVADVDLRTGVGDVELQAGRAAVADAVVGQPDQRLLQRLAVSADLQRLRAVVARLAGEPGGHRSGTWARSTVSGSLSLCWARR